jgi:hypothetical protein
MITFANTRCFCYSLEGTIVGYLEVQKRVFPITQARYKGLHLHSGSKDKWMYEIFRMPIPNNSGNMEELRKDLNSLNSGSYVGKCSFINDIV